MRNKTDNGYLLDSLIYIHTEMYISTLQPTSPYPLHIKSDGTGRRTWITNNVVSLYCTDAYNPSNQTQTGQPSSWTN